MGLTNQYLKYIASGAQFAQICSGRCNPVYVNLYNEKGRYVAVGGCENVFIYDTVKKEKVFLIQIYFYLLAILWTFGCSYF